MSAIDEQIAKQAALAISFANSVCVREGSIVRSIVVSLPSATERRALIEKEFSRLLLPFSFYDAIEGADLTEEQMIALMDTDAMRRNAWRYPYRGSIANWSTQMGALRQFAYSDDTVMAVFEDDVRLDNGVKQVLGALSDGMHGFDIIKLSWNKRNRKFHKLMDITASHSIGIINDYDYGSEAYVISRSAARHLVESFPKMQWQMDHVITRYWESGLTVGILSPPVATTDKSSGSQITKGVFGVKPNDRTIYHYPRYSIWQRVYAKIIQKLRQQAAASRIIRKFKAAGDER